VAVLPPRPVGTLRAVGALAVLCAAGCREPLGPVTYLADLPGESGHSLASDAAEVGGEARPILFPTERFVGRGRSTVPPSRELEVALKVPAGAAAGPDLEAIIVAGGEPRMVPVHLEAEGRPRVRLEFEPEEVGNPLLWMVKALPRPGERSTSLGPIRVGADMRLRLGMALDPRHCGDHPPTILSVDLVDGAHTQQLLHRLLGPKDGCTHWTDVEVPLPAAAARLVSLRFRAHALRAADRDARLYPLWGDPVLVGASVRDPKRPSVILLSLDTLGARHVGAYGYRFPTSPALDALAAEGTLFERALSHYPSTAGSHTTLLTSVLPVSHGVRAWFQTIPADVSTLAESVRRQGCEAAAVTEDALLSRDAGFGRGFHRYWENRALPGQTARMARRTLGRALGWLRSRPPEPFFLFVHTYEVHDPHNAPLRHQRAVRPRGTAVEGNDVALPYDAEVRLLDQLVGRFVRRLEAEGILERTVVIITGDHGEAFGEHGTGGHGTMLYDEVMRVPLILRGPGVPRGRRVPEPVGLVDVMPTVLDLMGIQHPEGLQGRSLLPALRGEPLAARPLIAEVRGRVGASEGPDLRAVWLDDHKAILDEASGRWQVFDLRTDPREQHDLGNEGAGTVEKAKRVLAWYETLGAERAARAKGETHAPDGETRQKLRALGYVE
jgi:arylsulfatase A-like enzyme